MKVLHKLYALICSYLLLADMVKLATDQQMQSLEDERKKMSQLLAKLELQICQKEKDLDKV